VNLAWVNGLSGAEFIANFGDIAEHSPWVADRAAGLRPFASVEAMCAAFETAMMAASRAAQLALLCAHPDLAGKAAIAGELTDDSTREQAGAGLDRLTEEEFERFTVLNTRYLEKFGIPFIFAVKGATKHQILAAFEERVEVGRKKELQTALAQVAQIFRFRIEGRVGE
jgi:2-oxo-4-hydroxy-4-carboxy-5-ureidoimidazoline decarboxylase